VHEPGRRSSDPSDEALAQRVQRGDREALERLVARYLRPIHAVMASYLRERADIEDAVQDTFLRALHRIAAYQPPRPFAPWLYQIARNVARDRIATELRRRTEPFPEGDVAAAAASPDLALELSEIRRHVAAAIEELPEQQRTAFRLHDVEGYTTNDVARIMGLSVGTVRSHVHYARRALRLALATVLREPKNAGG
jgi:RNA polymerase sigma-70 factor (ECF subfamily)